MLMIYLKIILNINTICNENKCFNENDNLVNFYVKKYEIEELPLILSINTNINDYNELVKYNNKINTIFKKGIQLYNQVYKLIGFVNQASFDHYVTFLNHNDLYSKNILDWFIFDDLIGPYKLLNNTEFSLNNIRSSELAALIIYLRQ